MLKSALVSRLLVCLMLVFSNTALAGDFWFYEWMDPPLKSSSPRPTVSGDRETGNTRLQPTDKRWVITEFDSDPYRDQLKALQELPGVDRISVLFKRPPAAALADDYVALARAWKNRGLDGHFKFVGSLPTKHEASLMRPVCDLGVKLFYVTNFLPGDAEIENLNSLRDCIRIDFVLNRYFRFEDVKVIRKINTIPITLTNNYFPIWANVDNLNLAGAPVELRIARALPMENHIKLLNKVQTLTGVIVDLDMYPYPEQYDLMAKIDRSNGKKFSIRFSWGAPRDIEFAAWKKLAPNRVQVMAEHLQTAGVEQSLRALDTEVIIEMFAIKSRALRPEF